MSAIRRPANPVFGRYQPIALLGEGSVARVYLAVSRAPVGWGNLVVIKEIRPELAGQPQFREMFLHEARVALGLHHPNIVETYEIFEERAPYVVAMEFLDGQTMANLLKRVGRLEMPLPLHLWMLTQVLAGLHHAHEVQDREGKPLRIVHRDVSPSNVMVTYDGQIKLVDFGIAKLAGTAAGMPHHQDTTAAGKLGYGAPEQFVSQPIDPRSDVYSVGVMMWEAIARRRRRVANNPAEIIDARIAGAEPPITEVVVDVPPALAEICDRATAHDRRARYQNAFEFQLALDGYLDGCWEPADARQMSEIMDRTFSIERATMRRCLERQLGGSGAGLETEVMPVTPSPVDSARASAARWWGRSSRALLATLRDAGDRSIYFLRRFGPALFAVLGSAALIVVLAFMTARPRSAEEATTAGEPPAGPAPPLQPLTSWSTDPPPAPPAPPPALQETEESGPAPRPAADRPSNRTLPASSKAVAGPWPRRRADVDEADRRTRVKPNRPGRALTPLRDLAQTGRRREAVWNPPQSRRTSWTPSVEFEPGEDLPPPDRVRRTLDEGDPYRP